MKFIRRSTALGATLAIAATFGCTGTPPTTAPAPVAVDPNATVPTTPDSAQTADRIQLLDIQPGKPAEFVSQAGKSLTVVASAASYTSASPSFRLSVTPATALITLASRFSLANTGAPDMPFNHAFTDTTAKAIGAMPPAQPGIRHLAAVADARQLGDEEQFWVNTGDSRTSGDRRQTAVLQRISEHAYFFVDKQAKAISKANLDRLVSEWESKIYPRVTGAFGAESKPGVDGDDRLYIVISPAVDNFGQDKGLMGYFWSRDAIPNQSEGSHSNQKEALFMTDQLFDYPELTSFGTLAHEFQHLINFSQKAARSGYTVSEETWLDEGMSMYAMEVAGYGLPAGDMHIAKDLNEFEQDPAAYSLTDWSSNPHGFAYGQSYLFVRYMVDRYGPGVLKEILASNRAGQAAVEDVLTHHQDTFATFFRAWTVANLVTDQPIAKGTIYHYDNLPLEGDFGGFQLKGFQTRPATSADLTANLRPWGTAYYTFSSDTPQTWHFRLGDSGAIRLLGAAIVP